MLRAPRPPGLDELGALAQGLGDRFCTWHVLPDVGTDDARHCRAANVLGDRPIGTGYIDEGCLREHCFPTAASTYTFVCGPPAMVSSAVLPALTTVGFDEDHVFEFWRGIRAGIQGFEDSGVWAGIWAGTRAPVEMAEGFQVTCIFARAERKLVRLAMIISFCGVAVSAIAPSQVPRVT